MVQFRFLVEFLSLPRYILNHLISPTETLIETLNLQLLAEGKLVTLSMLCQDI